MADIKKEHFLNFPKKFLEVTKKIEKTKELKNTIVRSQKYEEAAKLRDAEKQLHSLREKTLMSFIPFYEESQSLKEDVNLVLDLKNEHDSNYINAIYRLPADKFAKYDLIDDVIKFKKGKITYADLEKSVDNYKIFCQQSVGKNEQLS